MQWYYYVIGVWLLGDIALSINFLARDKRAFGKLGWRKVLQAFYDSLFWVVFLVLYGVVGIMEEWTGKPWK